MKKIQIKRSLWLFLVFGIFLFGLPNFVVLAQNVEAKQNIIDIGGYVAFTVVLISLTGGVVGLITVVVRLTNTVNNIKSDLTTAIAVVKIELKDDMVKNRESISILKSEMIVSVLTGTQQIELLKKDVINNRDHIDRIHVDNLRRISSLEGFSAKHGYIKRDRSEVIE